jgi:hypothetical protein
MENETNQAPESMEIIEEIIIETPADTIEAEASAPQFSFKNLLTRRNIIIALVVVAILLILGLAYYLKSWFIAATVNGEAVSRFAM